MQQTETAAPLISTPAPVTGTVIAEGLTGKALKALTVNEEKRLANARNKKELSTLSFHIAQMRKHAAPWAAKLSKETGRTISADVVQSLAPAQLVAVMSEKEQARTIQPDGSRKWSFWLFLTVVTRFAKEGAVKAETAGSEQRKAAREAKEQEEARTEKQRRATTKANADTATATADKAKATAANANKEARKARTPRKAAANRSGATATA